MARRSIVGALAGWKRQPSDSGVILTLQVLDLEVATHTSDYSEVSVALNDRQIRSLARDLKRVADERGLKLWGPKRGKLSSALRSILG